MAQLLRRSKSKTVVGCIYLLKQSYSILFTSNLSILDFFFLKYTFNGYLLLFRYFEYYYTYTSITNIVLNNDFKTISKATARKIFIKHYRNYYTCIKELIIRGYIYNYFYQLFIFTKYAQRK